MNSLQTLCAGIQAIYGIPAHVKDNGNNNFQLTDSTGTPLAGYPEMFVTRGGKIDSHAIKSYAEGTEGRNRAIAAHPWFASPEAESYASKTREGNANLGGLFAMVCAPKYNRGWKAASVQVSATKQVSSVAAMLAAMSVADLQNALAAKQPKVALADKLSEVAKQNAAVIAASK